MRQFERLLVLWSDFVDGTRHTIGHLWRDAQGFAFGYVPDLREASERGFALLPEFPEQLSTDAPFRSRHLFSTFAQRIPSPKRSDYARILQSWGLVGVDDQLEILAISGGIQMTDRIEFTEHREITDTLVRPLVFRVAGSQHYEGQDQLQVGDLVELKREPANKFDPSATLVLVRNGTTVGYVPRPHSALVARLVDEGRKLEATAFRRLTAPAKDGRWLITLRTLENSEEEGDLAGGKAAIGGSHLNK